MDKLLQEAVAQALGLDKDADGAAIAAAARTVQEALAGQQKAHFVPAADHKAALARAEEAEQKLAAIKEADKAAKIDTLLNEATAAGKIAPSTRAFWTQACQAQGLDAVKAHFDGLPASSVKTFLDPVKQTAGAVNPEQGE